MAQARAKQRLSIVPAASGLRPPPALPFGLAVTLIFGALVLGFFLYSPTLQAPFIFDDSGLPFWGLGREEPVSAWMAGVRPALMFSYWATRVVAGDDVVGYHAVNIAIHIVNAGLVFLVLWRLLLWSHTELGPRRLLAALGAIIFLVHPLQTESVSYVAGRSESLAALFVLLAYVLFLYRRSPAISWLESVAVVVVFGIALLTKENAVCLAGILILTDVYWPQAFSLAGLRANWRLYAILTPGVLLGLAGVARVLASAKTAGFAIREFTPYQYALTEARAVFAYIRLAVAPIGQSVDHDFPASRNLLDHGAVLWALLLIALVVVSVRYRRRFPLACFGLLFFLIALAPTSSFVPIADPLVERRMYLPIVGLVLAGCDLGKRIRLSNRLGWAAVSLAVALFAFACYQRNQAWSRPSQLFMDAAARSTNNARPYLNATEQLVRERRCDLAPPYLERAEKLFPDDSRVQVAWSWALECLGRPQEALQRLLAASRRQPAPSIYEQIGFLYGELGRVDEAGTTLRDAVARYPSSGSSHEALAFWHESLGDLSQAETEYRTAMSLNQHDWNARAGLARVQAKRRETSK